MTSTCVKYLFLVLLTVTCTSCITFHENQYSLIVASSTRGGKIFPNTSTNDNASRKEADATTDETMLESSQKRAQEELKKLKIAADKMAKEAEKASKKAASEIEKVAKTMKKDQVQSAAKRNAAAAKEKAVRVAQEMEAAAAKKAAEYEKAFLIKKMEMERAAAKRKQSSKRKNGPMDVIQKKKEELEGLFTTKKNMNHNLAFVTKIRGGGEENDESSSSTTAEEAVQKVKDAAKKRAQQELKELEVQAKILAKEAERAARKTAKELEKVAKIKTAEAQSVATKTASNIETAARAKAVSVAEQMQKAATKKLAEYEKLVKAKADEVERLSKETAAKFEKGAIDLINPPPPPKKESLIDDKIAQGILYFILVLASGTAITNILGFPNVVIEHWEVCGFGDKFFPFGSLDITQKRSLAGLMEIIGVVMISNDKVRKFGCALIAVMYTWGTIINTQLDGGDIWKPIMTGVGATAAWLLLANEISKDKKE